MGEDGENCQCECTDKYEGEQCKKARFCNSKSMTCGSGSVIGNEVDGCSCYCGDLECGFGGEQYFDNSELDCKCDCLTPFAGKNCQYSSWITIGTIIVVVGAIITCVISAKSSDTSRKKAYEVEADQSNSLIVFSNFV